MVKRRRIEQMWVDPEFAALLRMKANTKKMRYVDYTRELARNPSMFATETELEERLLRRKRRGGDGLGRLF